MVTLVLQGCATGPNANPDDPLEPLNRTVFGFNESVDRAVIKPVAIAYRDVTPLPIRRGVSNFFGNISDVWSFVNSVLQAKPTDAVNSFFRVTTNTFWGLGGIIDIASDMRIPKQTEDFGQTLGYWGVASGPYVVLPILGPSTVRDSAALIVDFQGDLVSRASDVPVRNSLSGLRAINLRSSVLNAGNVIDEAALEKYSFTRDAYLQRRQSLVRNSTSQVDDDSERFDLPEGSETGKPKTP